MVEEMKLREGYKETQVGVIPEDWEVVSFETAFKFLSSGNNSRNDLRDQGTTNYIHYGDIHTKWNNVLDCDKEGIPFIDSDKVKRLPKLEDGDLILADASEDYEGIGKAIEIKNIRDKEVVSGLHTFLLRGDKSIFADGFKGYIQEVKSVKNDIIKITTGTSVYGISKRNIRNILIPVPPLGEQKVIAKTLTDTDSLIQSIGKLIDKKEKIKKGTMQELLTGEKRLDGFSGEWEIKNLYELVEFINGKAHENFISDIGKYIVVNSRFVSTEGYVIKYSNQGNCLALTNDILMVMSDVPNGRAIAKCYYVEEDNRYTINQRVCILRSKNIISKFLFYIVDRNSHYLSFDDGVKQTNLKRDDVLNLNIKVPPLNEQKAISQAISDMDQEIQVLIEKLEKYKTIKQGMMQELLTGRIRLI